MFPPISPDHLEVLIYQNPPIENEYGSEIIRRIVYRMIEQNFTKHDDFIDIANMALSRIPVLQPIISPANVRSKLSI